MSDHIGSRSRQVPEGVQAAIEAFQAGGPVLIHDFDSREGETDLVYPARAVTPDSVSRLRNDAGGLVCVALAAEVADAFDLPFLHEALDHPATGYGDLGYDERSSFSLTVNHRDTYTGVTDQDRARTISALAHAAAAPEQTDFAAEFRVPGHVHIPQGGFGPPRGQAGSYGTRHRTGPRGRAVPCCRRHGDARRPEWRRPAD